jgi:hypothetical protein
MPTVNLEYRCAKEFGNFDRVNSLWLWIERYWFVATPLGIICGLFLFFTHHLLSEGIKGLTFWLTTMSTTVCCVFVLFYIFLFNDNTLWWIGWIVMVLGILIGIPFSYLSIKYLPCACISSALPAGVCLAMIFQVAVIYMIQFEYAIYMAIGAFSLITIIATLYFKDHAISIMNAISSSYVIMRCIGLIFDYPYEFAVYYEINVMKTKP